MTQLPVLYSFRRCPYAIRARMALQAGQRRVELREVLLKDKPQELLDASAKATVPVLVMADGSVLDESLDIMQWALAGRTQTALHLTENWPYHELIRQFDGEFKDALDRYKYADRFPEASASEYRQRAMPQLQRVEEILSRQQYIGGAVIDVLDIAVFPFIRQFVGVDRTWFDSCELHHLRQWLNKMLESELFVCVMRKYKPWKRGDAPVVFPY